MKKSKGMINSVPGLFISILASVAVVIVYFSLIEVLTLDADLNQIGRKYILEMETEGYLTSASKTKMEQLLCEKGATEIDFSGTTMSSPGYGEPIHLKATVSVPLEKMNIDNGLLEAFREEKVWTFTISLTSTAKY